MNQTLNYRFLVQSYRFGPMLFHGRPRQNVYFFNFGDDIKNRKAYSKQKFAIKG